MKYSLRMYTFVILLPLLLRAEERLISFDLGSTLQYSQYEQGCLPKQVGFVGGIDVDFQIHKDWRPSLFLNVKGLWDIPYIASKNGLFIDITEYQALLHFGLVQMRPEDQDFYFIPFIGVDYYYLRHSIEKEIISLRYDLICMPFGMEFNYQTSEHFSFGIKGFYDLQIYTRARATTPCLCDTDCCKIQLKRKHSVTFSVPMKWNYNVDGNVEFTLGWQPLFSWQEYGASDPCKKQCSDTCDNGSDSTPTLPIEIPQLTVWHLGSVATLGIRF